MSDAAPCMWMRGGTSKGAYFLARDLPADRAERDRFLLSIMGSPDTRQIDGMGGADPLTSKVAVVRKSSDPEVDVDYLFLQVSVEKPVVSDTQNCGNILAGVAPFAIERGLVEASDGITRVSINMENTGQVAVATVETPGGKVNYAGTAAIDGVPGSSAPVSLEFRDTAGSTCGALMPTGRATDTICGCTATLIDNGMPCVVLLASELGLSGLESREILDADEALKGRLEDIRLECGHLMNLGDVRQETVPKMTIVSPPRNGGAISTRTFIPHRCHASIGVLGAVTVATSCLLPGSASASIAVPPEGKTKMLAIEHPAGQTTVVAELDHAGELSRAAIMRTARKLYDGVVFAH